MIRSARRDGVQISVETCPHYLFFTAEKCSTGRRSTSAARRSVKPTTASCCGAASPTATSTASCPTTRRAPRSSSGCPSATSAWHGAGSPACRSGSLPSGPRHAAAGSRCATSSAGWRNGRQRWQGSTARARRTGYDADFAVFAPDDAWIVDGLKLRHRNPVTPYAGRPLAGGAQYLAAWRGGQRRRAAWPAVDSRRRR